MSTPLFCPNKHCPCHIDPDAPESKALRRIDWFKRSGTYMTKVRGEVQRYACKRCGRGFSEHPLCQHRCRKEFLGFRRRCRYEVQ